MTEAEEKEENELIHFYQDRELKLEEENTVLKAKLQKVTDFVNSCSRSAVANMIKGIFSE